MGRTAAVANVILTGDRHEVSVVKHAVWLSAEDWEVVLTTRAPAARA